MKRTDAALAVVREAVQQGRTDRDIARQLGVSDRTILRWRQAAGIPTAWTGTPLTADHGTPGRHARGCRCDVCRLAHNARMRDYMLSMRALTPPGPRHRQPWTDEDDAILTDTTRGSITDRALILGRSYAAANVRLVKIRRG